MQFARSAVTEQKVQGLGCAPTQKVLIVSAMNLPEYIRLIGPKEFATRFGVSERAAVSWQYGARRPRTKIGQRIVANSPVTWDGIYGSSVPTASPSVHAP